MEKNELIKIIIENTSTPSWMPNIIAAIEKYTETIIANKSEDKLKASVINNINSLYPTDSDYQNTNAVGEELLAEAKKNVGYNWRDYPINVLQEYERLCIYEEKRQARRVLNK